MAERKRKVEIRYPTVSCEDAPVPPALPVPNCECGIPAEVKQSRWLTTAGRAYYMCSVSGKCTPWVPEEIHITGQSCVCSFNGLMDQTSLTLGFGFSHMIRMRQSHSMNSRGGCLLHLILLQWPMKKSKRQRASAWRTLPFATVDILPSCSIPTLSSLKNSLHSSVAG